MTNFVVVHGAWHGGWCWTRVARLLRGTGHDVMIDAPEALAEILLAAAST